MFKFIKIFLFIGLITVLSLLATENPGQVIINWLDIELKSTVPVFIVALLILWFGLKIILSPVRVISKILSAPKKLAQRREQKLKQKKKLEAEILKEQQKAAALIAKAERKEEKAAAKENKEKQNEEAVPTPLELAEEVELVAKTFLALQSDDYKFVKEQSKKLNKSESFKNSSVSKLISAVILEAEGSKDEALKIFNELYMLNEDKVIFIFAAQKVIKQALETNNVEKAFLAAQKVYEQRNDVKWLFDIYFDLLVKKSFWKDALMVIDEAFNNKLITEERHKKLKAVIFYELSLKSKDAGDVEEAMKYAISASEIDHSFNAASILVSQFYAERGLDKKAAGALSRSWRIRPIPELAHAYVNIWKDETVFENVQRVEQLALANNKHPLNDIMLAEYNIKAGLWGPARKHLDIYMSKYPTTKKIAMMMADFEEGGNKDIDAAKEWLNDAENAEPDPMWICSKCYGQAQEWQAFCPCCNSFASIEWLTPGRTLEQEIEFEKAGMKK
ncbi:MAG: hypothetical protein AB7U85_01290 [Alphaproteobacteria bacterium]